MIFQLPDNDYWFPDPLAMPEEMREPDGLYAFGGDLHPRRLIEAYSQGIFPWTRIDGSALHWYCPMKRFVIFPDEIHISHSMRTLLNKGTLTTTSNKDFHGVIRRCSEQRIHEDGAWLGERMVRAYTALYELGYAHSIEVWQDGKLVGGLYGVAIGNAFIGESMFSDVPSASKVALISLAKTLQTVPGSFIDCQFETPHLRSMGGRYIPYQEYLELINN